VKFEWDNDKNKSNHGKHNVWFEEAQTVWADEYAIEFYDPDHSETEDRFLRVGHSSKNRVLLVVFCERDEDDTIRIISARKATKKEKGDYEKGI
jgi:uncharacterized DUF497 family protein